MRPTPARQHGTAALIVVQLLLFAMALLALYVHRSALFEQRTSANQVRATKAFEAAEAGIEWATAMLNASAGIDASCTPGAASTSFRDRYLPTIGSGDSRDFQPLAGVRPGCRIDGTTLACACPSSGTAAFTGEHPVFTVSFADVAADPHAIVLSSAGCSNAASPCVPGAGLAGEGLATVHVILKWRPALRAVPASALTTGSWAEICGAFAITNRDTRARGQLIDAGSRIRIGQATYAAGSTRAGEAAMPGCAAGSGNPTLATLPGTPAALAMSANDDDLHDLSSSAGSMFAGILGMPLARLRAQAAPCLVEGGDAQGNAQALLDKLDDATLKCRHVYVDGPLRFTGEALLGSPTEPVMIVSSGSMSFEGRHEVWGLLYAERADWSGSTIVHGAAISRQSIRNEGIGSIDYDGPLLETLRNQGGRMVRVPGSWRDF